MKQTALQKFIEQITPLIDRSKISDTMLHNLVEEHLEMEKQQIIEAFDEAEVKNTTTKSLNQNNMKNIHLIPTEKPSMLCINGKNQIHIYITSSEEIKEGDWMYYKHFGEDMMTKYDTMGGQNTNVNEHKDYYKKIILTTDQDLIKDGVQAIDDEFLEWFVKNPTCEEVEVNDWLDDKGNIAFNSKLRYQIIIPKEEPLTKLQIAKNIAAIGIGKKEPKQETLQEVAESRFGTDMDSIRGSAVYDLNTDLKRGFIEGAKWQQEQILQFLYSEITERRPYSSSKMCEVVIEFIEQLNTKK